MKRLGGIKLHSRSLLRPWWVLEKWQGHHLHTETLTEAYSRFHAQDFFSLQDQTGSQGSSGCRGRSGVQGGVQHPHPITSAPNTWGTRLQSGPAQLQAAVALCGAAFQGPQRDNILGTDAKPVYCVYYASASGVTNLNPSDHGGGMLPVQCSPLPVILSSRCSKYSSQQLLLDHGKNVVCTKVT